MSAGRELDALRHRRAPIEMSPDEFRALGHRLVDRIAELWTALPSRPVTTAESPAEIRRVLGADRGLPATGTEASRVLDDAADMLFGHSLFNGHPRFFGYITSSPAPIGVLGDLLAAAVNQNMGAWKLSPMATEIEAQSVRWIAELIGFPADCGGLLVSGGNMANLVCLVAARAAKATWDVRKIGVGGEGRRLLIYGSTEVHTWIQKAADLSGLGTDAIRWIATDAEQRMRVPELRARIEEDRRQGAHPFLVVGTAGSVSTGAIDPLPEIRALCREFDLWFHVDGAYGALAAQAPNAPETLRALSDADSVAVDPHKWLYAPLEAGCALVRRAGDLRNAFAYHPAYYHFDSDGENYVDYGPQNSRGFRALKVWLALRQVGRAGYLGMIADDILLARHLHELMAGHPECEAVTHSLSIATFRYVPADLRPGRGRPDVEAYLDRLNQDVLTRVEQSGEAFLSNAVVDGRFVLRVCIVNFRTSLDDVEAMPGLIVRFGKQADDVLRSTTDRVRMSPP
jgi:glutamate/tyrosine decarboxylase-like PLP-dependent enzyme